MAAPEAPPPAATPPPCTATTTYAPVCGLHAPEDLDTLGDSSLLVVQMRGMTGKGESSFATIEIRRPRFTGSIAGRPRTGACASWW
jgi:hypothetical protein